MLAYGNMDQWSYIQIGEGVMSKEIVTPDRVVVLPGLRRIKYRIELDQDTLRKMAIRAADSKNRVCKSGALIITITDEVRG